MRWKHMMCVHNIFVRCLI